MNRFTIPAAIIFAAVLCFQLLGCTGYKKYNFSGEENLAQMSQKGKSPIQVGKFIKVQTVDGQEIDGTVDAVNEVYFVLSGMQVSYVSIESVQVHELLWVPTIATGAATAFTVFVLNSDTGTFSTD